MAIKKGFTSYVTLQSVIATMKQALIFGGSLTYNNTGLKHSPLSCANNGTMPLSVDDSSDPVNQIMNYASTFPFSGTLKNLYIWFNNDYSTAGNYIITIRKNGSATAVTINTTAGGSNNPILISDTAHSVHVDAGDLVCMEVDLTNTDSGQAFISGAVEFDPD